MKTLTFFKLLLLSVFSLLLTTSVYSQWELCSEEAGIVGIDKLPFKGSYNALYRVTYYELFKSTDKGASWSTIFELEMGGVVQNYIYDYFVEGSRIWLLGHDLEHGYFLTYSDDAGDNWEYKEITDYPHNSIVYHDGVLILAVNYYPPGYDYGMYRSFDNGDSWEPIINIDINQFNCRSLFVYKGVIFSYYAATIGMYRSDDLGETWTKCNNETNLQGISISNKRIAETPVGLMITYHDLDTFEKENVYSMNGNTWIRDDLPNIPVPYVLVGNYQKWFCLSDTDSSPSPIIFSPDQGATWVSWNESDEPMNGFRFFYLYKDVIFASNTVKVFRRYISEAVIPPPPIPDEIESLGGMNYLITYYGVDSPDDLPQSIIDFYLDAFEDTDMWNSPEEGMQPGTCSLMGMPVWKINSTNLQLYIKDKIFSSDALGPNPMVDMHFNKNSPLHNSTLGNFWSLGLDMEVEVTEENVFLISGKYGKKVFPNTSLINGKISLRENVYSYDSLFFDGIKWHYYLHNKGLIFNFLNTSPNIFILESISDSYNNYLLLSRNLDNQVTKITDASAREILFSYSGSKCIGFSLSDGRSASFSYNSKGLLSTVIDLAGIETNYTYNTEDEIETIDIDGKVTSFTYELIHGFNRVVSTMSFSGDSALYDFTPIDNVTNMTKVNVNGKGVSFTSVSGKTSRVSVDYGMSAARGFNENGLLETFIGIGNIEYSLSYDGEGNPLELKREGELVNTLAWDDKRNLTSKTNALGNTWAYEYDSYNRLVKILSPENRETNFEYYSNGLLKKMKRGTMIISYEYDEFGNNTRIINPNGGITVNEYSNDGYQLLSVTSPEGRTTTFNYDGNKRLTNIGYADGNGVELLYDCCAQIGKVNENGYESQVSRTDFGLISQFTDEEGYETNWLYDERLQPMSIQNSLGNITEYTYGDNNKVQMVVDEELGVIRYWYNNQNELTRMRDPNNIETEFLRSYTGQLEAIVYPWMGGKDTIKYLRNDIEQIVSVTNLRKQTINMTYDADGNAISRIMSDETHSFNWDASAGQLISYSDNSGSTVYQRNTAGFIDKITYPTGLSVEFEYDFDGNQTKLIYPEGLVVNNTINNRNRIENLSWFDKAIALTYDGVGNLLEENRGNNSKSSYSYFKNNKLKTISHTENNTVLSDYVYTRDAMGNITSIDMLPIIIPAKAPDLWYNYVTDYDNQLISNMKVEPGTHAYYQYDKDGNCTFGSGTIQFEAEYNQLNQLLEFNNQNTSISLTYDAMGNVNSITTNGVTKLLSFDHKGRLLFETDISGNISRYYIYKAKRIMAFVEGGVTYYLQYDQSGNTIYIRDENNTIVNKYIYSSFGEIMAKQEQLPYQFTFNGAFGVFHLTDGYYLMRTRLYQATNGRFLQRDPINLHGDVNGYRFVGNNPFSTTDPYGMDEEGNSGLNASALDGGYDYEPGVSGSTPDIYDYSRSHKENGERDPTRIIGKVYKKVTDSPAGDLIPGGPGTLVSMGKAYEKYKNGDGFGQMAWQFVPFNNTLEMMYEAKKKDMEKKSWDYYHMPDGRDKLVEKPFSYCNWW